MYSLACVTNNLIFFWGGERSKVTVSWSVCIFESMPHYFTQFIHSSMMMCQGRPTERQSTVFALPAPPTMLMLRLTSLHNRCYCSAYPQEDMHILAAIPLHCTSCYMYSSSSSSSGGRILLFQLVGVWPFVVQFVWSRKGFIRTRWNLYGTWVQLIYLYTFSVYTHSQANRLSAEAVS